MESADAHSLLRLPATRVASDRPRETLSGPKREDLQTSPPLVRELGFAVCSTEDIIIHTFPVAASTEPIYHIHGLGNILRAPFAETLAAVYREHVLRYGRSRSTSAYWAASCGQCCAMDSGMSLLGNTAFAILGIVR